MTDEINVTQTIKKKCRYAYPRLKSDFRNVTLAFRSDCIKWVHLSICRILHEDPCQSLTANHPINLPLPLSTKYLEEINNVSQCSFNLQIPIPNSTKMSYSRTNYVPIIAQEIQFPIQVKIFNNIKSTFSKLLTKTISIWYKNPNSRKPKTEKTKLHCIYKQPLLYLFWSQRKQKTQILYQCMTE